MHINLDNILLVMDKTVFNSNDSALVSLKKQQYYECRVERRYASSNDKIYK